MDELESVLACTKLKNVVGTLQNAEPYLEPTRGFTLVRSQMLTPYGFSESQTGTLEQWVLNNGNMYN